MEYAGRRLGVDEDRRCGELRGGWLEGRHRDGGWGPWTRNTDISYDDTDLSLNVGLDKGAPVAAYTSRSSPGDVERGDGYHADLRYLGSGAVQVQLMKRVSGGETVITTTTMSGLTVAAGDGLDVRVQAFGSSPTTLRAKV